MCAIPVYKLDQIEIGKDMMGIICHISLLLVIGSFLNANFSYKVALIFVRYF